MADEENRQGMLSINVNSKSTLYSIYMPFIKNGGLFIPTQEKFSLGDEVFVLLTLPDETEKIPVSGKVVWIAPKGMSAGKGVGVGMQFSELDEGATRFRIEKLLAGTLTSSRQTYTM